MTDVRLVLRGLLVLDQLRSAARHHIAKSSAHLIVTLSVIVAVVEPTHDDDMCKVR